MSAAALDLDPEVVREAVRLVTGLSKLPPWPIPEAGWACWRFDEAEAASVGTAFGAALALPPPAVNGNGSGNGKAKDGPRRPVTGPDYSGLIHPDQRDAYRDDVRHQTARELVRLESRARAVTIAASAGRDGRGGALPTRSSRHMTLPPPPEHFHEPYLFKERFNLIDGTGGIGKGLFVVSAVAPHLAAGENIVWLPTEDDPEDDIYRRLLAVGYDQEHHGEVIFLEEGAHLYLPEDRDGLRATLEHHRAGTLVLDPVRSFLRHPETRSANYNADSDMRPGLECLNQLARAAGATIVGVHHWGRSETRRASASYSASSAFNDVPRYRVSMARVGEQGAMAVTKANQGATGHLRCFGVEEAPDFDTARFVPGEVPADTDLDVWYSRMTRPPDLKMAEPGADELGEWILARYPVGTSLPGRDDLRDLTRQGLGMTSRALAAAMKELVERRFLSEVPGRPHRVVGQVSTNGHRPA